jgi:LmbE family N-acetylglucosaminyl deacetylase
MLPESEIIPYHLSRPAGERVVVLAPHPDDETLGCGGTIRLLTEAKKPVKVIFLTSGDKADPSHKLSKVLHRGNPPLHPEGGKRFPDTAHLTEYALLREKEAAAALNVLGVSDYVFMRFPDRELHEYFHDVRTMLSGLITEYMPDTVYCPSPVELNPDHRTTAALVLAIQDGAAKNSGGAKILFYEVATPLRPNMLVDITAQYSRKKKAIRKYRTQLRITDYLSYCTSLNVFRTLTLKGPRYAEAFLCVNGIQQGQEVGDWLGYRGIMPAELRGRDSSQHEG